MATNMKICTTLYTLVFLFTLCLFSSHAAFSSTPNGSCDTTPYPAFCKTTLPASQYLSIQDQCRFFLQQSLSITKSIFNLVSSYLRDHYTIPLCHRYIFVCVSFLHSFVGGSTSASPSCRCRRQRSL